MEQILWILYTIKSSVYLTLGGGGEDKNNNNSQNKCTENIKVVCLTNTGAIRKTKKTQ